MISGRPRAVISSENEDVSALTDPLVSSPSLKLLAINETEKYFISK